MSLAERTFFAVPHFHFMTAFQTQPKKGDGFFRLQRFSSLSFLLSVYGLAKLSYSCNAFPHFFSTLTIWPCITSFLTTPFLTFFSTLTIWPCIPSFPYCPTGQESRHFSCQNRINIISLTRYFVNFKLSSASRFFCIQSRETQFSISTRYRQCEI